jgi:hypothetical protein
MEFFKNNHGIHLMCTSNSEYTICGIAWDGTEMFGDDDKEMKPVAGFSVITCKACKKEVANIVEYLRARAGKSRKPGKLKTTNQVRRKA